MLKIVLLIAMLSISSSAEAKIRKRHLVGAAVGGAIVANAMNDNENVCKCKEEDNDNNGTLINIFSFMIMVAGIVGFIIYAKEHYKIKDEIEAKKNQKNS